MQKMTGYYSEIRIDTKDNVKYIEKRYPLAFYTRDQIEDLRQRVLLQRHAFEELHIPISELVNLEIMKIGKNFNLIATEKFEGYDFADVVDEHNFEMYLEKMLYDIYKPLLKSTTNHLLHAGIDTVVRNYVYRSELNEFCYVDFMPPKVFYKGHYTQEVPEIKGPFYDIRMLTHNDRAGVVYTLYINLARKFPAKRKFILAKFEQFLEGINESHLSKHINESPFYRLDDAKKAKQIVSELKDWQGLSYLILREAACFAAETNKKFSGELDDFFKLTHHETDSDSREYGLLPKARFEKAKKIIINNLNN